MKIKFYKKFFQNKKITLMGLGLLGRGLGDAKFLATCGAELTITDLKKASELEDSLKKLKKYSNIKYSLGGHNLNDFKDRDFILRAANVPFDSPFLLEAQKNNIPIKMSASWFVELAREFIHPNFLIIGITGTKGKSTVTHALKKILKDNKKKFFFRRKH